MRGAIQFTSTRWANSPLYTLGNFYHWKGTSMQHRKRVCCDGIAETRYSCEYWTTYVHRARKCTQSLICTLSAFILQCSLGKLSLSQRIYLHHPSITRKKPRTRFGEWCIWQVILRQHLSLMLSRHSANGITIIWWRRAARCAAKSQIMRVRPMLRAVRNFAFRVYITFNYWLIFVKII